MSHESWPSSGSATGCKRSCSPTGPGWSADPDRWVFSVRDPRVRDARRDVLHSAACRRIRHETHGEGVDSRTSHSACEKSLRSQPGGCPFRASPVTANNHIGDGTAPDAESGANMTTVNWRDRAPLSGLVFVLLAVAGNALQGSTPALHGDADAVADFYNDKATAIAVGMMLSLISVFFLAWFLAALGRHLRLSEGADSWVSPLAGAGGGATLTLLAAGVRAQLCRCFASARERHRTGCRCRLL